MDKRHLYACLLEWPASRVPPVSAGHWSYGRKNTFVQRNPLWKASATRQQHKRHLNLSLNLQADICTSQNTFN